MLSDVTVIKGKGRTRLEVTLAEITLLDCLEIHRLLTTEQLYGYYTKVLNIQIHAYSFKNRLRRLEEFRLVRSANFAETFEGERFKYYSIGSGGVDLLIEKGVLSKDYNKNQIYQRLEKKNKLHFLYTQEAVLNIMCSIKKRLSVPEYNNNSETFKVASLSPSKVNYDMWIEKTSKSISMFNKGANYAKVAQFMNNNQHYEKQNGKWITIVRPDWIIKREFFNNQVQRIRHLNIELDTGTESLEQLEDKIWKYCLLAEQDVDVQHGVLFVLPDESFSKKTKYGDRSQRIKNIKDRIFNDPLILEKRKKVRLAAGVVSLKDAGIVGSNYLAPELFK